MNHVEELLNRMGNDQHAAAPILPATSTRPGVQLGTADHYRLTHDVSNPTLAEPPATDPDWI